MGVFIGLVPIICLTLIDNQSMPLPSSFNYNLALSLVQNLIVTQFALLEHNLDFQALASQFASVSLIAQNSI